MSQQRFCYEVMDELEMIEALPPHKRPDYAEDQMEMAEMRSEWERDERAQAEYVEWCEENEALDNQQEGL